jgi:ActR/RegA family two-component response regulator
MAKPVLVVVDDEDASLQALARELESRYGAYYRVVSGSSAEVALARLAELKAAGLMCRWCWPISRCRGWAGRSCWRG